MVAEMHRWDGSHISFLRKTELASADALAGKPWVGAARVMVACCAEILTTDLPGDGIRPAVTALRFHVFQHLPAVRAAGRHPQNGRQRHAK
jgi:hypothetical protein